jgi:hypothetical protein
MWPGNTPVQFFRDWLAHPQYDDYWAHVSVEHSFDKVLAPAFTGAMRARHCTSPRKTRAVRVCSRRAGPPTVGGGTAEGGWFDIFLGGTLNGFVGTKGIGWGSLHSCQFLAVGAIISQAMVGSRYREESSLAPGLRALGLK